MPSQPPHDRLLPGAGGYEPALRPVEPGESAGVVSFRQAVAVVRRRMQLILAITAVGAALGLFLASRDPTTYRASAMLRMAGERQNITGGGPTGNIPRCIPDGLEAVIDSRRWHRPPVFDWLQRAGNVTTPEMYRTFNCGLGMTICVPADVADRAVSILNENGERATLIGEIRRGTSGVVISG